MMSVNESRATIPEIALFFPLPENVMKRLYLFINNKLSPRGGDEYFPLFHYNAASKLE
jgi:hypothetical protein